LTNKKINKALIYKEPDTLFWLYLVITVKHF